MFDPDPRNRPVPLAPPATGQTPATEKRRGQVAHGEFIGARGKRTPEYNSWRAMRERCYLPSHDKFQFYGGRGIRVCDRWIGPDGFANFLADMGRKPTPAHSVDRKDNNKDYSPDNCRWATKQEQARNKRSSRLLVVHGRTATMSAWAEETGISIKTIWRRKKLGWSDEQAVLTPTVRGAAA